ncbi:sensor histidine kinase [Listeria ilorinensis]|uniref:sensor histidine kinase n=1 Tax=Listeria ilorinensis TaxID=2867439 RepID=UPI001EF4C664|nr:sensor histidine kinase [Listeria ilorinensis]
MKKGKSRKRIFKKMMLIFSLTSLFTVCLLLFFIYRYYNSIELESEMRDTANISNEQLKALSSKEQSLLNLTHDIYKNSDLMQDVQIAMTNDYSSYIAQNIDNYFESKGFYTVDMQTYFQSYFSYDENVIALQMISQDGKYSYTFPTNHEKWTKLTADHKKNELEEVAAKTKDFSRIHDTILVRQNVNDPATLEPIGFLVLYVDASFLDDFIKNDYQDGIFTVENHNSTTLYSNQAIEKTEDNKKTSGTVWIDHKKYYLSHNADAGTGLQSTAYLCARHEGEIPYVEMTLFGIGFLLVVFSIGINYVISNRYSKRINAIIGGMDRVEKGELDAKLELDRYNDELTEISERFNHMTENLDEYIKKVYALEIEEQKAQLKALQVQVQPHFLYNSLEAIRMNARIENAKITSKMIYQLATLLRYTANHREITTLSAELNYVEQYLRFMELRYEQTIDFSVKVEKKWLNTAFPKFGLQPLIENFFKYGRSETRQPKIDVQIAELGEDLEVIVRDNGRGMTSARLREVRQAVAKHAENGHIGLANLNKRLELLYGNSYGITIDSQEHQGTEVRFRIPKKTRGEEEHA